MSDVETVRKSLVNSIDVAAAGIQRQQSADAAALLTVAMAIMYLADVLRERDARPAG